MENRAMRQPLKSASRSVRHSYYEEESEPSFSLHLEAFQAEGIDSPSRYPCVTRKYQAIFSIRSDSEQGQGAESRRTREVEGLLDPVWKESFCIPLKDKPIEYRFLDVEVIRVRSTTGPGPSTGVEVVGRGRIPTPVQVGKRKFRRFGLVRPVGERIRGEGHISVAMEFKKSCKCRESY